MECTLCLESCFRQAMDIFSDEGIRLNVCNLISKYFWFKPNPQHQTKICKGCWANLEQFDNFYTAVAQAHNHLESSQPILCEESDPLPITNEHLLKCENQEEHHACHELLNVLEEDFFDPEVKLEVNDLDLLPQIEIIEESANVSNRTLRACRRAKNNTEENSLPVKRVKKEKATTLAVEDVIQCENLAEADTKLDEASSILQDFTKKLKVYVENTEKPVKRGRGRPKKLTTTSTAVDKSNNDAIKSESPTSDINGEADWLADTGTEDSADSSSESNSEESLPDVTPEERYAEIPKRVIVKPKKYRKRQKPLVPPRRMTREEIDKKNAQQAQYEKDIFRFFEKFACPKCNLLVQNFDEMRKHFRASHNDEPGYMACCGRKFHYRKALAEHIYIHWNPEHFKCTVENCERVFHESRALEQHEQFHINPQDLVKVKKVFQCDKCPKSFTTKAAFEYHTFSKHVPKSEFQFTCTECNKKLPTARKLKDHMKYMHDPESAIICDKCGKQVRSYSNLKKHHQIEHSEVPRPAPVPVQCEICGTWLRHLSGLKQHMKSIHEDTGGEHRCHICNKTSTTSRALKRHIYHNHECERKFKCTMCEKAFKRPQDLREHTSTHTGEVLYTCPNCPMTFFSNANMYKHRQRLHRAEYEADRKKPGMNIMRQATGATAAMKMQQAVGATSAFFAHKLTAQAPQ